MKNRILAAFAIFALIFSLTACQEDTTEAKETDASGDWRNKIEYEGNFYVNRDTKLLYALDRGTITLWDNKGDGAKLQVLEYNSAESGAIESLEIADMNGDGNNDISTVFAEGEGTSKYNLWLWDSTNGRYKECKAYRNINNPVISEDKTTITGTVDKGIFGSVVTTYSFTADLDIETVSSVIDGVDSIADGISKALAGGDAVSPTDGIANVQGIICSVYAAESEGKQTAYIAHTPDSYWYIDLGCVGVYRMINDADGIYTAGGYVDGAGSAADLCSDLYECDLSKLSITKTSIGVISALPYDNEGNVIYPEPTITDEPDGMRAEAFEFALDGQLLCTMLRTANDTYYCYDPTLTGDQFFHLVSSAGEAVIVPQTAHQYFEQ